ncbi:MAG: class I SAM-dependent methyltransferase [Chlorobi bacterium]|nr:class I SAM-dependent methyltransferase [Chlorobiota bacterium]
MAVNTHRCVQCDSVYSNPMPININQFYESENPDEYFDVILTKDDILKRWESIQQFMQNDIKGLARVLDVGAGIGIWTRFLAKRFNEVIAIEPSGTFFKVLKKNTSDASNIQALQCTLEEFASEHSEARFDLVFIHEVLEHVPNPVEILSIARNMLKNSGIIYICVPNNRWLTYELVKLVYGLTGRCFTPHLAPLHPPFHLYEFSKNTIRYMASMLNLDIVAIQTRTDRTYVPGLLHPIVKFFSRLLDKGYEVEVLLKKST